MNDDDPAPRIIFGVIWRQLKAVAPYGGTLAAGLLAAGGFFVDLLNLRIRIVLLAIAVGFAVIGVLGIRWRAKLRRKESDLTKITNAENARLRNKLADTAPETVLRVAGGALFVRPGGWRLTLFVIERTEDDFWCLKPLLTSASSEVFEASPHGSIPLSESRLREVLDIDAIDPQHPFSNESANLPDREVDPDEWRSIRSKLIPGDPDEFCMPTRKFGWVVTNEPVSRRTLVLLCESVLPDGIQLDVVRSQLLSPTIALIARMSGMW